MKRAALLTGGTQVGIQALGLLTGILVARLLGPDGRGQLAAVISWPSMLAYLGNLGLPVALTYAAAREPLRRHQLMANSFVAAMCQWLILGLVGWVTLPALLARHGTALSHLAVLYLWAYLPLNLLTLYTNAILQGSSQYTRYNAVRLSVPIAYASLLVIFWTAQRFTIVTVVLVNVLSNVAAFLVAMALAIPPLLRLARTVSIPLLNLSSMRRNMAYGLSAQIGTLQPFSGLRIDVLALTILSPTHDLGLYIAALAGANLLRSQGYALGQVVLPEVAKRGTTAEQWRIVYRFMTIAAAGSSVAFLIVMLAAAPALHLIYGTAFVAAAPMLRILVAAGGVGAMYRILADGIRGMGKPGVSTIAELMGVGAGLLGLILLVPLNGATGAAWAVLISSATSFASAVWLSKRYLRSGAAVNPSELETTDS